MTREEAIFCERSYIGETDCRECKYYGTDTCASRESHRMAVEALSLEPCSDAISREAVLAMSDFVGENPTYSNPYTELTEVVRVEDILALPSVQPKPIECEDAISRKDMISLVQKYGVGCLDPDDFSPEEAERFLINKIKALPPMQPKMKVGHWVKVHPLQADDGGA